MGLTLLVDCIGKIGPPSRSGPAARCKQDSLRRAQTPSLYPLPQRGGERRARRLVEIFRDSLQEHRRRDRLGEVGGAATFAHALLVALEGEGGDGDDRDVL